MSRLVGVALLMCVGCAEEELPGFYWQVTVEGDENLCTGNGIGYSENFEYRVIVDVDDASFWIGDDNWATGNVDGCNITYDSIAWSDYRDGYELQWQLTGDATVNIGGPAVGCVGTEGLDWDGTETFTITNSAHPEVQSGCTYTLNVYGTYLREVPVQ
jgi:hypothetical protein